MLQTPDLHALLADYQIAFFALAVAALIAPFQSLLSAPFAFFRREQVPGMPLRFNHSRTSFRVLRTYSNTVESLPAFGFAVLLASVAGAAAGWVNGLAVVHVGFRLAFWAIYYAGIGKPAGGPRTLVYLGGLLCNIALSMLALVALA